MWRISLKKKNANQEIPAEKGGAMSEEPGESLG